MGTPYTFPYMGIPLVTDGIVFSGHITEVGKPYKYNIFGSPIETALIPNGILIALDNTQENNYGK